MQQIPDNVFGIPEAKKADCRVEFYKLGSLRISVAPINSSAKLTLVFSSFFIQCPRIWRGATFKLASDKELLALCQTYQVNMTDKALLTRYRLYVAEVDEDLLHPNIIKIVATKAAIYGLEDLE